MAELLAKLTPPRIHDVFERTRLYENLDRLRIDAKVIWVSAPAGSGKTTLIASYLQSRKIKPLWYQMDEGDGDMASFFYYMCRAAKQCFPRRKALPLLTPEYQLDIPAFTRYFYRALFAMFNTNGVLVYDNAQNVGEEAEFNRLLATICNEIPHYGQVIFISRRHLPDSLVSMSVTQELRILDWSTLRLSIDESAGISKKILGNSDSIRIEQLNALYNYTDGWTTGLILYLRRFQQGEMDSTEMDAIGKSRSIANYQESLFTYFVNELFIRLDKTSQNMLLKLAFLQKITVESANQLISTGNANTVLPRLEKNNFFITKKGFVNAIYEFHPLFLDFLRLKCQESFLEEQVNRIKYQSANVSVKMGNYEIAASLFIELRMWNDLKDLIIAQASDMEKQGRHTLLRIWIGKYLENGNADDAFILYWQGISELYVDPFLAYELFERSFRQFEKNAQGKWCYLSWLGIAESIFLRQDEYACVLGWIQKLAEIRKKYPGYPSLEIKARISIEAFNLCNFAFPHQHEFDYWKKETEKLFNFVPLADVRCVSGVRLSVYYAFYAKPQQLANIARKVTKYASSDKVRPIVRIFALWTELTSAWMNGNQIEAERAIEKATSLSEFYGVRGVEVWVYSAAIFNFLVFNNLEKASEFIDKYADMGEPKQRLYYNHFYYLLGWYELARGNFQVANRHLEFACELSLPLNVPYLTLLNLDGLSKTCICLGDYEKADKIIRQVKEISGDIVNHHYIYYDSNLVLSWSMLRQSKIDQARQLLKITFAYGNEQGEFACGCLLHSMLLELCEFAVQEKIEPEYTNKLIAIYRLRPTNNEKIVDLWPYQVKIYTLGRFVVLVDNKPVLMGRKSSKKVFEQLKVLIAFGGDKVNKDIVIQLLWPDQDGDAAQNSFNTCLHRLRKVLGRDAILYSEGQVTLNSKVCWVDIWSTERHMHQLLKMSESDLLDIGYKKLMSIFELYQGPFLHSEEEQNWVISTKERLHQKLISSVIKFGTHYEKNNLVKEALELYKLALDFDDLQESFYQGILRSCIALERPAEGITYYQRCRRVLYKKLNVNPSRETENLRTMLQKPE